LKRRSKIFWNRFAGHGEADPLTSPHEQALAAATAAIQEIHFDSHGLTHEIAEAAIAAYLAALPAPDLSEWEKAAEGVTPGPWTLKVEGDDYIVSAPTDTCLMSDEPYYPTAPNREDAIWIARCSPDNVLSALRSLSARLAEAERERDAALADNEAYAITEAQVGEPRREEAEALDDWQARAEAAEARAALLAADLNEARANVGNLLARIHRDGGHYEARHGTAKAVADADLIVAELFARKETPNAQ